jgi:outer membrane immunogenic protein
MHRLVVASLTAASLSVGLTAAASAADLGRPAPAPVYTKAPPLPISSWTGFYAGGNVGYGWGQNTGTGYTSFSDVPPGGLGGVAGFFAAGGNVLPGVNPKGVIGGGQIGYDWQVAPVWVVGLVTDIQASGMKASGTGAASIGAFTGITESNSAKVDWFGTTRARAGFLANNNLLIYGTGGVAYGQVKDSTVLGDPSSGGGPSSFAGSTSSTKTGWAAGAGIDYAFTPHWRLGAEYLHVDLGTISVTETQASGPVFTNTFTSKAKFSDDIARLLLNYKF